MALGERVATIIGAQALRRGSGVEAIYRHPNASVGRTSTEPAEEWEEERGGTRRSTPASRSALITVTSVLLYAVGMLVTTGGFVLVSLGGVVQLGTMFGVMIASEYLARLPLIGSFAGLGADWLFGIGGLLVVAGILELGAGSRLWSVRRSGGMLGLAALGLGMIASVFFLPLGPTGQVVGLSGLIVAAILLGLLGRVWWKLQ